MAEFQKSSLDAKIFNLFALLVAAGIKCEYCIKDRTYGAKET